MLHKPHTISESSWSTQSLLQIKAKHWGQSWERDLQLCGNYQTQLYSYNEETKYPPKLCDSNYNQAVRDTHLSQDSGVNLTLAVTFLECLWTKMWQFLSPDNDRIKFLYLTQWLFLLCNRPRSSGGNQTLFRFKNSFWFKPMLEDLLAFWK